jgi:hypothetical protein
MAHRLQLVAPLDAQVEIRWRAQSGEETICTYTAPAQGARRTITVPADVVLPPWSADGVAITAEPICADGRVIAFVMTLSGGPPLGVITSGAGVSAMETRWP